MDLFSRLKVMKNGRIDVKMLRTLIHDQDQHIHTLQQQIRDVENEKMEMQASHSALEQDIGKLDVAERDPSAIKRLENMHVGIVQKQTREHELRAELSRELNAQDELKQFFSHSFDAVVEAQVPFPRGGRFDWNGALDTIIASISTSKPRVSAAADLEADADAAASIQDLAFALESIMPPQEVAARPTGFVFVLPSEENSEQVGTRAAAVPPAAVNQAPTHAAKTSTDRSNQPAPPPGGYSFKETGTGATGKEAAKTTAAAHGADRGEAA